MLAYSQCSPRASAPSTTACPMPLRSAEVPRPLEAAASDMERKHSPVSMHLTGVVTFAALLGTGGVSDGS